MVGGKEFLPYKGGEKVYLTQLRDMLNSKKAGKAPKNVGISGFSCLFAFMHENAGGNLCKNFSALVPKKCRKNGGEDLASKNEEKLLQNMEMLKDWASVGISQKEIARRLEMSYSDFRVWRDKIPALSALFEKTPEEKKRAKAKRVEVVEESMYDRCTGYNAKVKKYIKLKKAVRDSDGNLIFERGKVLMEEELVEVEEEQHVPGDVGAQKFFLMNQARRNWKSDPEKLDHDKQRVKNDTKRTELAANSQSGGGEGKSIEEILEDAARAAEHDANPLEGANADA